MDFGFGHDYPGGEDLQPDFWGDIDMYGPSDLENSLTEHNRDAMWDANTNEMHNDPLSLESKVNEHDFQGIYTGKGENNTPDSAFDIIPNPSEVIPSQLEDTVADHNIDSEIVPGTGLIPSNDNETFEDHLDFIDDKPEPANIELELTETGPWGELQAQDNTEEIGSESENTPFHDLEKYHDSKIKKENDVVLDDVILPKYYAEDSDNEILEKSNSLDDVEHTKQVFESEEIKSNHFLEKYYEDSGQENQAVQSILDDNTYRKPAEIDWGNLENDEPEVEDTVDNLENPTRQTQIVGEVGQTYPNIEFLHELSEDEKDLNSAISIRQDIKNQAIAKLDGLINECQDKVHSTEIDTVHGGNKIQWEKAILDLQKTKIREEQKFQTDLLRILEDRAKAEERLRGLNNSPRQEDNYNPSIGLRNTKLNNHPISHTFPNKIYTSSPQTSYRSKMMSHFHNYKTAMNNNHQKINYKPPTIRPTKFKLSNFKIPSMKFRPNQFNKLRTNNYSNPIKKTFPKYFNHVTSQNPYSVFKNPIKLTYQSNFKRYFK